METSYRSVIVDGHEVFFASEWINQLEAPIHFEWYYQQASLVYSFLNRKERIIEIGLGTGLLSDLLRKRGWTVWTVDIDKNKNPDFCSPADEFDYKSMETNAVLAFEIFEHIPLKTLNKLLKLLAESEVKTLIFSVPKCEREIASFSLKIPRFPRISRKVVVPRKRITTKAHFWELSNSSRKCKNNKDLISQGELSRLFLNAGYNLEEVSKIKYIKYFVAKLSKVQ